MEIHAAPPAGPDRAVVPDGESAISVTGLRKAFGKVQALDGVDLEVPRGTVLGLLGPNGAGKTTVVRIVTTLLKPDAGSARVVGLDVVTQADEVRERIGLAGQYAAVDENLTGLENLTMVGRLYGAARRSARDRGRELLGRFDLVDAANRPVKTYSGGMRRRLDLAAALVAKPPVLFLDEPTTGLDPRSRLSLWETIEDLVSEGTTVLLTTQYLDEADRLADTIAVIDHGRVIAEGTSDQLKDRVGGERLEVTLDEDSDSDAAVRALASMGDDTPATCADGVVTLNIHVRRGAIVEAVRRLSEAGIGVDDLAIRRPTLDDVFLTLTGHAAEEADASARTRVRLGLRLGLGLGGGGGMRRLVSDTLIIAERNLIRLPRAPDLLLAFTVQPIMFVLLFRYVFGGAISVPGGIPYVEFLIPGIIVQNIAFGGFVTALGLNEDVHKGLIDRFRSLPMARPAVLAGRTLSDVVTNSLSATVLIITGLLIGFSFQTSVPQAVGGFLLLLLFGYGFSWMFAWVGLLVDSPEAANSAGFIAVFPLTFISSAFVPVSSMPPVLQDFAKINPFTIVVDAMRALWIGTPAGNYVWGAVVWSLVIIAIFAPLAVARYRRAAAGRA